jgi:hypothetical protein
MNRILKRIIRRDSQGNVMHEHAEITVGDDTSVQTLSVETFQRCESCLRPLKPDEPRGICQICGRGACLSPACSARCSICSRNICGRHKRGVVAGETRLTVCPICLPEAERAAALARELAIESSKAQLLHSSLLDRLPGIGVVRQIAELKLLTKLEKLEDEMRR